MKPIQIDEEAEAELIQAVLYYERRRPGLGHEFSAIVADCLDQIQQTPDHWATIAGSDARKCSLKRFPYEII